MSSSSESAMNHAGRTSDHSFADLRSASRARKRTRTQMKKYWHFQRPGLTRADLPSSPSQKPHYLPNSCPFSDHCTSSEAAERCVFSTFPADLSTAPVAKFTKKEAYQEAQLWPRPPKHHSSRHKKGRYRWGAHKTTMRVAKRDIINGTYVDDAHWFNYMDKEIECMSQFERYREFGQFREIYEGVTYDEEYDWDLSSQPESEEARYEKWENREWLCHRNFAGIWFYAKWLCRWDYCDCPYDPDYDFSEESRHPQMFLALGECVDPGYIAPSPWEQYESVEAVGWDINPVDDRLSGLWDWEKAVPAIEPSSQTGDWDMVSTASEAWTEVEAGSDLEPL